MPESRTIVRRSVPSFARYATLAARALRDGVPAAPAEEGGGDVEPSPGAADAGSAAPLEQAVRRLAPVVAAPGRGSAADGRPAKVAVPYAGAPPAPARRTVDRRC